METMGKDIGSEGYWGLVKVGRKELRKNAGICRSLQRHNNACQLHKDYEKKMQRTERSSVTS